MASEKCERCGNLPERITEGPFAGSFHLLDYCFFCSKDLCDECLDNGKCRESKTGKHVREDDVPFDVAVEAATKK